MSATTASLPSPQAWSPNVATNAVSTTPLGMPPRTPASVGQMAAPILGSGGALSPRVLRDSCNGYFGVVDFNSNNPPNSTAGKHTRKTWNLTSGSPGAGKQGNRQSSEYNFESAGFVAGHRITSSFEKQTQALRDRDRRAEERREMQTPPSPHAIDAPFATSRYDDKTSYMSIDPHSNRSAGEAKSSSTLPKSVIPLSSSFSSSSSSSSSSSTSSFSLSSSVPSPALTMSQLRIPLGSESGNGRPSRITLPPQLPRHSLACNKVRTLQRSETSPACVDQGNVQLVTPRVLAAILKSSPENATLLLDVRPYPQFAQAKIKGALNLCIPTTLLKRPSFNLQKLEDTFTGDEDKKKFARWQQCTQIIVYDSSTTHLKDASPLINVLKKFTNEGWKGETSIMRGGFAQFSTEYPDLIESNQRNEAASFADQPRSISLVLPNKQGIAGGCSIPDSNTATHPFFSNIRQNMDLIDGVGQIPIKLPQSMCGKTLQMLPRWLTRAVDAEDKGKLVSYQFLQIERAEQKRMQEALTCRVSYGSPGSKAPKKSFCLAGLEKGSKNRYNNIYPFDYSRVRLQGVPSGGCDYVNASFIESSRSNKRYIATQAPIPATFNDFWRVVWEQDIRVIVMLTAESEGPQLKCHPYWKAADYGPLKVSVFAEHQISLNSFPSPQSQQQRRTHGQRRATSPFTQFEKPHATEGSHYFGVVANDNRPHAIVRHLTLTHTAYPFQPIREITQLQYSHWPDFGAPAEPAHLVRLVEEANRIAHASNASAIGAGTSSSNRPATTTMEPEPEGQRRVLVHCSAGCGRTGTYCTVDSVVDMLKRRRAALADRKQPAAGGPSGDGGDDASEQEDWLLRDDVDLIAATVEEFRTQRISMVQSLRQLVLCYESVLEWITQHAGELGMGDEAADEVKMKKGV
ncbi:protein tyrosine phosphatase [Histoplasma capsulatum]|uniref:protein-tyrosine-phosphatase n=1 Tax=Ajellomyces capsulatus TaxID=5037 RepID=A0A8A1MQB8_AJECA|nr:predicted protein [Histoplasma mississippiense (nom. inval.)]EDN11222.1 predicted protein [Histoplasma mississippiense (nom. inval.)]QSS66862.1 protein tyrosine phosphatase [Histoplasma capsulatum]